MYDLKQLAPEVKYSWSQYLQYIKGVSSYINILKAIQYYYKA